MTLLATAEPRPLYKDPNSPEMEGVSGEWRTNRNEDGSEHVLPYAETFESVGPKVEVKGAAWSFSAERRKSRDLTPGNNDDSFHVEEDVIVVAQGVALDESTAARAGQIAMESVADELLRLTGDEADFDAKFRQAFDNASYLMDSEMEDRKANHTIAASLIATKIVGDELCIGQVGSGRVGVRHADGSFEWVTTPEIGPGGRELKSWIGGGDSLLPEGNAHESRSGMPQMVKYKLQTGDRVVIVSGGVTGEGYGDPIDSQIASKLHPLISASEAAEKLCSSTPKSKESKDATAIVFDVNPDKPESPADQLDDTKDDDSDSSDDTDTAEADPSSAESQPSTEPSSRAEDDPLGPAEPPRAASSTPLPPPPFPSPPPYAPRPGATDTLDSVFRDEPEIIKASQVATDALARLESTPWYKPFERRDAQKAYDEALETYLTLWDQRVDEYVAARRGNGAHDEKIEVELARLAEKWAIEDVKNTQEFMIKLGGRIAEFQKWYAELSKAKKITMAVVGAAALVGGGVAAPVVLAAGAAVTGASSAVATGLGTAIVTASRALKSLTLLNAGIHTDPNLNVKVNGRNIDEVAANAKRAPKATLERLQYRNKRVRNVSRVVVAATMLGGSLIGMGVDAAVASTMVEASSEVTVGGVPEATSVPLPPDALGGGVPTASVPEAVTVPISPEELGGAPVAPEAAPTVPPAQTVPLPPDALGGPIVPEPTAAPTVPPAVTVPISPGDLGGVEAGGGGGPDVGTGTPEAGPSSPETSTTQTVTVEPGDTLWDIASASLDPGASGADIADRVGDIYEANADTIGSNPDLIQPGQNLIIPGAELPPVEIPSAELRLDSPAFTIPNGGGVQGMVSGLTGLDVGGPEASRLTGDVAKDLLNSTNPDVKGAFYFDYTKGEIGISNDGPLPPAAREAVLDSIRSHAHLR